MFRMGSERCQELTITARKTETDINDRNRQKDRNRRPGALELHILNGVGQLLTCRTCSTLSEEASPAPLTVRTGQNSSITAALTTRRRLSAVLTMLNSVVLPPRDGPLGR